MTSDAAANSVMSSGSLVNTIAPQARATVTTVANPWGGIMVSSDVIVDSTVKEGGYMEMQDLGLTSEAGVGGEEQPTYADELFRLTSMRWQRT